MSLSLIHILDVYKRQVCVCVCARARAFLREILKEKTREITLILLFSITQFCLHSPQLVWKQYTYVSCAYINSPERTFRKIYPVPSSVLHLGLTKLITLSFAYCYDITEQSTCLSNVPEESRCNACGVRACRRICESLLCLLYTSRCV